MPDPAQTARRPRLTRRSCSTWNVPEGRPELGAENLLLLVVIAFSIMVGAATASRDSQNRCSFAHEDHRLIAPLEVAACR